MVRGRWQSSKSGPDGDDGFDAPDGSEGETAKGKKCINTKSFKGENVYYTDQSTL